MDYKEKYEQGLECIQEILDSGQEKIKMTLLKERLLPFFPELKESEGERIRKALITFFQRFPYDSIEQAGTNAKEAIAWLEKQGEQRKQLINKACDVLVNCIEDFMTRRMEIWDEECKKQTLENIRKTLEK